jgi:hypothetical protein
MAIRVVTNQVQTIVPYTSDVKVWLAGISRLTVRPATPEGGQLIEGIVTAAAELRKREARRPVILALTVGGNEQSPRVSNEVLDELWRSHAALHVVFAETIARPAPAVTKPSDLLENNFNLGKVIGDGPKESGGVRRDVLTAGLVQTEVQQVAADLLSQYEITYARPPGAIRPEASGVRAPRRRGHRCSNPGARGQVTLPVIVVLDNIRSLYNTGAFFRTADAVRGAKAGALRHYTAAGPARTAGARIAKTALGSKDRCRGEYEHETHTALTNAHRAGYQIAVIETSSDAVSLFDWAPAWPVCVVFGHETGRGGHGRRKRTTPCTCASPCSAPKRRSNVATAGEWCCTSCCARHRKLTNWTGRESSGQGDANERLVVFTWREPPGRAAGQRGFRRGRVRYWRSSCRRHRYDCQRTDDSGAGVLHAANVTP